VLGFLLVSLAVTAAVVGSNRGGRTMSWFFLGLLFGPIGLALAFAEGKTCASCWRKIHWRAIRCPDCQSDIECDAAKSGNPQTWRMWGLAVSSVLCILTIILILAFLNASGVLPPQLIEDLGLAE
jgi:peptidoglycan/LPS O-acetylase OafA/YrhL